MKVTVAWVTFAPKIKLRTTKFSKVGDEWWHPCDANYVHDFMAAGKDTKLLHIIIDVCGHR